jgi:hypothetical protein
MRNEDIPGLLDVRLVMPNGDGVVIYTSLVECYEREFDSNAIRQWLIAGDGNGSDDLDAFPNIFEWLVRVPWFRQLVAVGFQIVGGEGAIYHSEMLEDANDRHI